MRSGSVHDFKTVSLFFLVTFGRTFDVIFPGDYFSQILKQPALKSNRFV